MRVATLWAGIGMACLLFSLVCVSPATAQDSAKAGIYAIAVQGPGSLSPSIVCQTCGGGGGGGSSTDDVAPVPAEKFQTSPGGVDMRSGQLVYSHTDLSIGGDQGIKLVRQTESSDPQADKGPFGGFDFNWDIRVIERRIKVASANTIDQYDYQVSVSGRRPTTYRSWWDPPADAFNSSSNGIYSRLLFETDGGTPSIPQRYTYENSEGGRIEFRPTGGALTGGDGCAYPKCAYAYQVSEPDGTIYTLNYDNVSGVRLRSVRSNRGYALLFEYAAVGPTGEWEIVKACALNLAYTAMPSISGEQICPAGVPTSTYTYTSGKLSSFVDQSGVSTLMGANGSQLYYAGQSTPYVTNTLHSEYGGVYSVTAQSFADGRTYNYSWVYDGNDTVQSIMGGTYTDNNGKTVTVQYGKYRRTDVDDPTWYVTPSPEVMTDEIGRSWTFNYGCSGTNRCNLLPVQKGVEPEGNTTFFTYGPAHNITQWRHMAKPGSGLTDIITSATYATYPSGCTARCTQPLTTTDALGHVTNNTYASTHGGLLTKMEPAPVANGARPLTVNTYAQRYAWTKNSSGTLVQESLPVWVLATSTQCQTVAGSNPSPVCDGSAMQTVTTYEYGANGTAQSLLVKGIAVSSGGVTHRTCYQYDEYARKIAETLPNANLSSCS